MSKYVRTVVILRSQKGTASNNIWDILNQINFVLQRVHTVGM